MRIFRFAFFIPALLCATGAIADACWEIKKCTGGTCQLSASSDTPSDSRYFQCGGNGGCASGAIIYAAYEYYKCTTGKWIKLGKDKLSDELSSVRECGDSNADEMNTVQVWVDNDTYDFFRENKSGTFMDKSDICKKNKTDKLEKSQKKPKNAEKSIKTATSDKTVVNTGIKTEKTQQVEQSAVKDAPIFAQKENNITISGTVVDENGDTLPQATIVVVGSDIHTVADDDGNFTITPSGLNDILEFRLVGFETVQKQASEIKDNTKITLKTSNYLQDVVVIECQNSDEEKDPETGKCIKKKPNIVEETKPDASPKPETPEPAPNPEELEEKLKSAKDALAAAKEKENSWANRALGATTTAATSLGAMQLAEGIAEKKADEETEKEMRAYISTMKCEYGGGKHVDFGVEETLPGGNELFEYYTEYKTLADNLKTTKAALGLGAGIESEVLYDRAQSGLYQYASTGKTGGGETSLFRALTDAKSTDATAWTAQKKETNQKLTAGGLATAVGVATGVIGNAIINHDTNKSTTTNSHTTRSKKTSIDDNTEYTQEAEQIILKERKRNDQCDDEECQKFSKCTDSGGMWKDGNCDCNGTLIEPTGDGITCKCKYQDKGVVLVEYMLGGSCECKTGTFWSASETRCLNKSEANKNETYCDERFGRWIKSKNECLDHVSEGYHKDDCKYSGGEYDYDNDACKCDKDKFLTNSEKNAFECECNDGLKWNKRQEKCVKPVLNTLKEAFNKKQRDNTAPQKTTKDDFDLVMNPINKKANYK